MSYKSIQRWLILIFCSWLLNGCVHGKTQMSQMRGIWLTTVAGLDWPPILSLQAKTDESRISMQKKALTDKLDNLVKIGINTVFFQVKPDGTALYRSTILPWSEVLTGQIGKDPGYDPLDFLLVEAHKRGIKVHAWLNPYQVSRNTSVKTVSALETTLNSSPASVYVIHPDWIGIGWLQPKQSRFVLDPGLPEVRKWVSNVIAEVVRNYNVDGIQFDDFFYYEVPGYEFDDDKTYKKYGQDFTSKSDWRRDNALLLIKQVSSTIRSLKPAVEFGVSPAGVWRNVADDPRGSDTEGKGPSYDTSYADTRQWVEQGLLDYIAPQLYWPISRKIVRYDVLAKWWAEVVKPTRTRLYIGVALYKVGSSSKIEPDWAIDGGVTELKKQLDLNEKLPEINGTILFREAFLSQPQTEKAVIYLKNRWHSLK